MIQTQCVLKFDDEVLEIALRVIDLFLQKEISFKLSDLHCLGATALLIASKFEESSEEGLTFPLNDFVKRINSDVTGQQIY